MKDLFSHGHGTDGGIQNIVDAHFFTNKKLRFLLMKMGWNCEASTLVVAEHDGGKLKDSTLSAIAAAGGLGESSTISVLLGGTGPALQEAASSASKAHPSITKVQDVSL